LFCFTHGFDLLGFFVISHGGLASKHCGAGQKLLPCLPRLGARRVRIQSLQRLRWLLKCVVIILVCSLFCEGIHGQPKFFQGKPGKGVSFPLLGKFPAFRCPGPERPGKGVFFPLLGKFPAFRYPGLGKDRKERLSEFYY
jgi:hypothetical protein